MRITKQSLVRRWWVTTALAFTVMVVMAGLESGLKGPHTGAIEFYFSARQYEQAISAWGSLYIGRIYLLLGLDYFLMPAYAMAFFYAGILAREAFAPKFSSLYRLLTLLAAAPIAGAMLDAVENVLEFALISGQPTDGLARVAFTVSIAKWMAIIIGFGLWVAAFRAWLRDRRQRRLRQANRP